VWFSQFLGLQIETQFCPGMMIGNPKIIVGARIEFFVARKLRGCWFFEIYIQGSKYNFLS